MRLSPVKSWLKPETVLSGRMKLMTIEMSKRGSSTVEASILFSVVFLMITALVYAFIIIYQVALLQSTANQTASIGAYVYVNPSCSSSQRNLYWRIYDIDREEKEIFLSDIADQELKKSIFYSRGNVQIHVSYRLLMQQITVRVEEEFPLPVGSLLELFGIRSTYTLKAEAISPLDDNAEFVRNMDTVTDIRNCLLNSDNKWIGEGSQVNEIIKKLVKTN